MAHVFRLLSLSALIALAVSPASAQSRQIVVNQIDHATSVFRGESYSASPTSSLRTPTIGLLEGGSRAYLEVSLQAGREYMISGFCDEDCSDLDLVLRTETGEVLANDEDMDDVPILRLTPSTSGRYLLGISMIDCETDLCYFGYSVFEKTVDI